MLEITCKNGHYFVTDNASTNGTFCKWRDKSTLKNTNRDIPRGDLLRICYGRDEISGGSVMDKTYYQMLGVSQDADSTTIKCLSKTCKKVSSDINPGNAEAEKMFKDVNEAYSVLSDEGKAC